jgi:hypothetical protein
VSIVAEDQMIKTYKHFGSVLVVVMVIAALSGCGDDSGDDGNAGTSGDGGDGGGGTSGDGGDGGTGGDGGSGTGGDGGGGTGGGGTGGTGGAMFTEQECIDMTETAMPMVPDTCAPCLCAANTGVAQCNANCWALLGCASAACGQLTDPERTMCVGTMCGTQISAPGAAVGARELGAALMGCQAECGSGGGEDAGM